MNTLKILIPLVMFYHAYAISNCDTLLTHGLRNIETMDSSSSIDTLNYSHHCELQSNQKSDAQVAQAHVEIFGYGGGSGGYNRTQWISDITSWCDTKKNTLQSASKKSLKAEVIYQGAVDAWDSCNKLNSDVLQIEPQISPDRKTIDIGIVYKGPTKSGILLYNIIGDGYACSTTSSDSGTEVKFPITVEQLSVQVHCKRSDPKEIILNNEKFNFTPRGTISVQSASHPFQIFFAEEYDPPAPISEMAKLSNLYLSSKLPVGTIVQSTLEPSEFMSKKNDQYQLGEWARADGSTLPDDCLLRKLFGRKNTPNLKLVENSLAIQDIVTAELKNKELVTSVQSEKGMNGEWNWFVSSSHVEGNRDGSKDYELSVDMFDTFIDKNTKEIVAQGRTLNLKSLGWTNPSSNGTANVLGISVAQVKTFHYIKIN